MTGMGSTGGVGEEAAPVEEIAESDLLYDDEKNEHYVAVAITEEGITLRRRDTEYYVPHTIFEKWYATGRMKRNGEIPAERPDWADGES
jgi:hypothetical protein